MRLALDGAMDTCELINPEKKDGLHSQPRFYRRNVGRAVHDK